MNRLSLICSRARPRSTVSPCVWSRVSLLPYSINRVQPTKGSQSVDESPDADGSEDDARAGGSANDAPQQQPGVARFLESQSRNLDGLRSRLRERATSLSASATLGLAEIGERLNKVTGYEHIEVLKRKVVETEAAISAKRRASRRAKLEYEQAVARRSRSQREVNDLLPRKSSWTEADVSRFTALVREDHLHEQEEARAKEAASAAEADVEKEFTELTRAILARYHEEQVWSDKIRSASTYGSLLALGVNIAVFVLAILVVEPWKRRRLAQTFETRLEALALENRALVAQAVGDLAARLEGRQQRASAEEEDLGPGDEGEEARRAEAAGPAGLAEDVGGRQAPSLAVVAAAKSARDRDLVLAGAAGFLGGGLLTLLFGFFK